MAADSADKSKRTGRGILMRPAGVQCASNSVTPQPSGPVSSACLDAHEKLEFFFSLRHINLWTMNEVVNVGKNNN
jgi:hypothetical protein